MSRVPDRFALIIGAMKSGTTSLFDLLSQHPEVAPARTKEPDFFTSDPNLGRGWPTYLELWDWDPARHQVALEASTSYAKFPGISGVPERIAASPARDVRFIYMVRNPCKRIESQVRHSLYEGWGQPLDAGLTPDLIDFSRYATQVDQYLAVYPRDRILIVVLEDLQRRPEQVLDRVCRFLDISPHRFVGAKEPRNTGDFYNVPPFVARLARQPVTRWILEHALPDFAKHSIRKGLARFGRAEAPHLGRWQLNPTEADYVRLLLQPEMLRLQTEFGVELPWLKGSGSAPPA